MRPGLLLALALALVSCVELPSPIPADDRDRSRHPFEPVAVQAITQLEPQRRGTQIIVRGIPIEIGSPVVLWDDPGGYNAYDTSIRAGTSPDHADKVTGARYRQGRPGTIDQFVLHYDTLGTSRKCFEILHHRRGLSVHFMLDIDGTLYQTMDVADTAWHATRANDRSIGVEIAAVGARPPAKVDELQEWYKPAAGGTRLSLPDSYADGGVRTANFVGYASRPQLIEGRINGSRLLQYDFTDEQYEALARLLAALTRELPDLPLRFPRKAGGQIEPGVLSEEAFTDFAGILGHYHVQLNKTDPGPAFDWDRLEREILAAP